MGVGLRPRFDLELACSSRDVITRVCEHFEKTPLVLRRTRVPGGGAERKPRDEEHIALTVPQAEQHFWSPWLTVEISPRGTGTHLLARFSPHPSVWTGFAFGYLSFGVVCAVALTIAASGALLPDSDQSWALWVVGGAAIAMIGMWVVSQIGQRLAHDQMQRLREELERAIEACAT